MKLFFDIETIPADEDHRDFAIALSAKKAQKFSTGKKVTTPSSKAAKEKLFRASSISGDFGRILCIGYAIENEPTQVIGGDEKEILENWWEVAGNADHFIGHNIMEFDLRFIFKRSIVNKIRPAAKHLNLSFARYRGYPIYDTMREWEKWSNSFISLDTLAKILGLESSKDGGIDGSQVYDFYLRGDTEKIYDYCKRDVELTRKVYKRMCFEE